MAQQAYAPDVRNARARWAALGFMNKTATLLLSGAAALTSALVRASEPTSSYQIDETKAGAHFARARREGATGSVNVVFRIDVNGKAYDARVETSNAEQLNYSALAFVNAARFVVASRDIVDLDRRYTFAFHFDLSEPDVPCPGWKPPSWADFARAICAAKGSLVRE